MTFYVILLIFSLLFKQEILANHLNSLLTYQKNLHNSFLFIFKFVCP